MAISETDTTKRYRIECHIFDGMGEDNQRDFYADTLEEAEQIAAEEENDGEDGMNVVRPEIVDQLDER